MTGELLMGQTGESFLVEIPLQHKTQMDFNSGDRKEGCTSQGRVDKEGTRKTAQLETWSSLSRTWYR